MDPKRIVHSDPEILGGTPVFVAIAFLEEASRALVAKIA
jgi:hypothetical protein